VYVVLLPWKLCSWLLTDTELVNDNQCAMQWRYRLQIIINDRLVLRKLSQHVSGVVYMCIQIKFIRKHTSRHSVTRLKLVYVVLLPWKLCSWLLTDTELVNDNQYAMQWRYHLQIIINDQLVLRKLSQHVSGVVYMCIQIKFIRKHTSRHSVTRLKLVYVVLLP